MFEFSTDYFWCRCQEIRIFIGTVACLLLKRSRGILDASVQQTNKKKALYKNFKFNEKSIYDLILKVGMKDSA